MSFPNQLVCSAQAWTVLLNQQVELWLSDDAEDAQGDSSEMPSSKRLAELRKVIDPHLRCTW